MKYITYLLLIGLVVGCAANKDASSNNTTTASTTEPTGSKYANYVTLAEALKSMGGVQVSTNGGETRILVRNVNSILGENRPLFVVNGIQRGRGYSVVSDIDPKTISSISVKSGLTATNRWGEQGNAGVILIKTLTYDN